MRKSLAILLGILVLAGLTGCASRPPARPAPGIPSSSSDRDGPEAVVPPDLQRVPSAEPRLENIRKGGPNKPYDVNGERYEPMTEDKPLVERGLASWYGKRFHGRPTSSGEVYNMYAMTAAHPTMPIPSYARVRNPANNREVIVRINDRGPFHKGRIIDLSYTAALQLDTLRGVTPVEVERITYEDIRAGLWQRNGQRRADAPVFAAAEPVGAPQRETTTLIANTLPEPAAPPAPRTAAKGFWLQFGAFAKFEGAQAQREQLMRDLDWIGPLLAIFKDRHLNLLQAGPYATRDDARQAAKRISEAVAREALIVERK